MSRKNQGKEENILVWIKSRLLKDRDGDGSAMRDAIDHVLYEIDHEILHSASRSNWIPPLDGGAA